MNKKERGITLISLIITILVIIILIGATIVGSGILDTANIQSIASDMLLIQTKVKIINEKVGFNGDTSLYVGQKLRSHPNKAEIAGNALTADEIEKDTLYIYDRQTLDSIGLEGIKLGNNQVYIVDYENGEIFWPDGVKNDKGEKLYKLSQIIADRLIEGEYSDDKVSPILREPEWNIDVDTIIIGVNAYDEYSGVKGYQFYIDGERQWNSDGDEWQTDNIYTFPDLNQETEYKIYYKVIDHAGNITTSEEYIIKTLKLETAELIMKLEGSSGNIYTQDTWVNKNVYLYFEQNTNNTRYWVEGSTNVPITKEPVLLTAEGTYSAYTKVEKGRYTDQKGPFNIKIDKTAPNIPNITEGQTYTVESGTKNITITSSSITDNLSGIRSAIWFVQEPNGSYKEASDVTATVQSSKTATCNFTMSVAGDYKFKIVIIDNAGNESSKETQMTLITHVHSYGNWVKVNDQIHRRTCSCGAYEDQNHTWGSWVTTKAATHSNTGIQTATCTGCNTTKTQTIAALGHNASCYSTACRGSFALSSTTSQTYYTCSHSHTYPGGNCIDGTGQSDDTTYTVSGTCFGKAIGYTCSGVMLITGCQDAENSSRYSDCCGARVLVGTVFTKKCNNVNCGRTTTVNIPSTLTWCSNCTRYMSSPGHASDTFLADMDRTSCGKSMTKYGLSCGYHSGTQNFTRSIQTYKCATCGKTTNLNLAASKTCSICGKTHAVSQSGSKTATHNTVPKYLICGQ